MKIYRVEYHARKIGWLGLYKGMNYVSSIQTEHEVNEKWCNIYDEMGSVRHPSPYDYKREPDIHNLFYKTPGRSDCYFFGFKTKTQLRNWFKIGKESLNVFFKEGNFYVKQYECDPKDVVVGNHQCAFIKNNAQEMWRQQLRDFLQ